MKKETNDTTVIFYWVGNEIHFISSSVISNGIFIAKNEKGTPINQKIVSNCNSEHLLIPGNNKTVVVSLISEHFQYTKTVK